MVTLSGDKGQTHPVVQMDAEFLVGIQRSESRSPTRVLERRREAFGHVTNEDNGREMPGAACYQPVHELAGIVVWLRSRRHIHAQENSDRSRASRR